MSITKQKLSTLTDIEAIRKFYELSEQNGIIADAFVEFMEGMNSIEHRAFFREKLIVIWECPICEKENEWVGSRENNRWLDYCTRCGFKADLIPTN